MGFYSAYTCYYRLFYFDIYKEAANFEQLKLHAHMEMYI